MKTCLTQDLGDVGCGLPNANVLEVTPVSKLTTTANGHCTWHEPLLRSLREDRVVTSITKIPLGGLDIRCESSEPAGNCSLKAIYKSLRPIRVGPQYLWANIWKLQLPPKIKMFLWLLLSGGLPLRATLNTYLPQISLLYVLCRMESETSNHLFATCPFISDIWNSL